jgi:hypothetical protein
VSVKGATRFGSGFFFCSEHAGEIKQTVVTFKKRSKDRPVTISEQYAELGRQVDDMESENFRLRAALRCARSQLITLDSENFRLRAALRCARSQLITLGGNPRRYPDGADGDMFHASVIETIDAVLNLET